MIILKSHLAKGLSFNDGNRPKMKSMLSLAMIGGV